MSFGFTFFFNSIMLGVGLAMDAFSVSLANGLSETGMKKGRMCGISAVFAGFQIIMPLIGWICVSTIAQYFRVFELFIPWIALMLLGYIGGKMLYEGLHSEASQESGSAIGFKALLVQGVATSIDALSVGFTIADYSPIEALASALLIGAVTFIICLAGVAIGKKAGTRLSGKAELLGGAILIFIGFKIFFSSL